MKRIAAFIVQYRYVILAVVAAVAALCAVLIPKVNVNKDMTAYLPDSSAMKQGIAVMAEEFSDLTQPNTLRLMVDDLSDAEKSRLPASLASVENITSVKYDPNDSDFNRENHTLYVLTTSADPGTDEYEVLKKAVAEKVNGRTYLLEQNNESVVLTLRLALCAVALVIVVLLLLSESWFEPLLYLFVIGISVVLNMGTNVFKSSVSETTFSIASILQLVLSMDYSIILTNRYRQELKKTDCKTQAMQNALVNAFPSIASSAMTTFIGLLMLLFIHFKIVPDLGIVLAKGVVCSLVCVLTALPALLIAFTGVIRKTEKRMLKIPTKALSGFSIKMRIPMTILFVLLFAGAFFFQTRTDISFSTSAQTGIKETFPADNTVIVLFDNADSNGIQNVAAALETDPHIRSVVSYPTLIAKQAAAEELKRDLSALSDGFPLETWMLRLLYYKYHTGGEFPPVKTADLLQFIADEVVTNPFFDPYLDSSLKDKASDIQKFASKDTLTREMSVQELADFFGIEKEPLLQMLVLYYTDAKNVPTAKITLPVFVDFLQQDVLPDPVFAGKIDAQMRAQIARLQTFTDRQTITTPMTSAEMASLLDTPESSLRTAYLLYNGLFHAEDSISPVDLLQFMTQNETIAARLDEETAAQMHTLVRIMENVVRQEACGYAQFPEIMGIDAVQAKQLLLLYTARYGDTSGWKLSPQTLVDFLAREIVNNPDYASMIGAEYRSYLGTAKGISDAVVQDKAVSQQELAAMLAEIDDSMTPETLQLLLTYYGSIRLYDENYTMSVEQLYRLVDEEILPDPAWNTILDESVQTQFAEMGTALTQAVRALKRERHSLLQITSKYPDESDETMRFLQNLHRLCTDHLSQDYYVIGESQMYYEMSQDFHKEIVLMTLLTAASVFLVVLLTFRNGLIPLLLVLVVQCGVYISMTVCYFAGDSMNYLAYLIVQCLLMGASIDYGILLTNYYREFRKADNIRTALSNAYRDSIHTILTSGSIMTGTAAVIGFASADPTIGSILRTLSVGSLAAILLILFVLPGMLTVFDRWIVRHKKSAHTSHRTEQGDTHGKK